MQLRIDEYTEEKLVFVYMCERKVGLFEYEI